MSESDLELDFRAVEEAMPGDRWRALFDEYWPEYEAWFLREGDRTRPTFAQCRRALRRELPELVPTWERLAELAGGGDRAARFLSLYRPPPFLAGCSQAIWTRDEVALVRNYDYAPRLCDGVLLLSAWTGPAVLAFVDCMWGVLDGMNGHGLAVALAFGGRRVVGEGFAITLILRALLETCATAAEARRRLEGARPHMAYTVTAVDAAGDHFTAYLGPDRPAVIEPRAVSTNHQGRVEWPEHARASATVERLSRLESALGDPDQTLPALIARFLEPPLYRRHYRRGQGTVYTSVYYPARGRLEVIWPEHRWETGFDDFEERETVVRYEEEEKLKAES